MTQIKKPAVFVILASQEQGICNQVNTDNDNDTD